MKLAVVSLLAFAFILSGCGSNIQNPPSPEDCTKGSRSDQIGCWGNLAEKSLEPDYCENIPSQVIGYGLCYARVAVAKKDSAVCQKFEVGTSFADACYFEYAAKTFDTSVCDKILREDTNSACKRVRQ